MNRIIIIEALGSGHGLRLVQRALSTDSEVVFVTESTDRYDFDLSKEILDAPPENLTVLTGVETTSVDRLEDLLNGRYGNGAAVVSQVDRTILAVAEACHRTGHMFLSLQSAQHCVDKGKFRAALRAAGLPGPISATAETEQALAHAIDAVGVPVILKPCRGTGSVGVRLAWTRDEALRHGKSLIDQGLEILVESYLLGPLLSVEAFRDNGHTIILGMTDRVLSDPPFFAELSWTFPLHLGLKSTTRLREEAARVLDAVGFDRGAAHLEFIWTADGPVAVEINPRAAGRGLTAMVSDLSPYDEYELIVAQAMGMPLPAPRNTNRSAFSSECVIVGPAGHEPAPDAVAQVSRLPGVEHIRLTNPWTPAQAFGGLVDLGEVRARGQSFGEAQMRARAASQALTAALIRGERASEIRSPNTEMAS